MSEHRSAETLPAHIDAFAFAADAVNVAAELSWSLFPRLQEYACAGEPKLKLVLAGECSSDGLSWLSLAVSGRVSLVCQRCLLPMQADFASSTRFRLVAKGEAWPDEALEDDGFDALGVEGSLDLIALVEDEVLLSLPLAPRHDCCELPGGAGAEGSEKLHPFAGLAKLKRKE